ncbi:MAG: hypothetical protein ACI4KN_08275 [Gemmiger sp.]
MAIFAMTGAPILSFLQAPDSAQRNRVLERGTALAGWFRLSEWYYSQIYPVFFVNNCNGKKRSKMVN